MAYLIQQQLRFVAVLAASFGLIAIAGCKSSTVQPETPTTQSLPVEVPAEDEVVSEPEPVEVVVEEPAEIAALPPPEELAPEPVGPPRVALLLPLSGSRAALGEAMLNAAQMALFDTYQDAILVPKDTQGTPLGARRAVEEALDEDVQLILGPLFSNSVREAAPAARAAGVPMVVFSNDVSVASDGVYLLGFTPGQQIERVIAFGRQRGLERFAALVPDNPYGSAVIQAMYRAADKSGAQIDRIERFDPSGSDATMRVENLARAHGGNEEVRGNFDAVVIASGGQQLKALGPLFPYFDLDTAGVKLLGTALWHDPASLGEPALIGGWFAAPPEGAWAAFARRYQSAFGTRPPRRAALAYDAVALSGALSRLPQDPKFSAELLTSPGGFVGTEGVFRFATDGVAERALAIYQVERNGFRVLNDAPQSFGGDAF